MILINGTNIAAMDTSSLTELERTILQMKQKSPVLYSYRSLDALLFELRMRSNIVKSAYALHDSEAGFATFENSKANPEFWTRLDNGGFKQNPNVRASDAINDIFANGALYRFECATAMVIILYKAILDTIGERAFNTYFSQLLLYDWNVDQDLGIITVRDKNEAYPGDVLYFKNPDHNPKTPEWQGENAIMLAEDLFFGHGIGIRTAEQMIADLNTRRIPGSTTSAYLLDQVEHPDFEQLRRMQGTINARIGTRMYRF